MRKIYSSSENVVRALNISLKFCQDLSLQIGECGRRNSRVLRELTKRLSQEPYLTDEVEHLCYKWLELTKVQETFQEAQLALFVAHVHLTQGSGLSFMRVIDDFCLTEARTLVLGDFGFELDGAERFRWVQPALELHELNAPVTTVH